MNKKININWKNPYVRTSVVLAGIYVLFLISPIIVSPILNSYSKNIEEALKTSTGFDTKIEKLGFTTAPNLSAGIKVKNFSMSIPSSDKPFIQTQNASLRIALLPFLAKRIQIANISTKEISTELGVKKDGTFQIMDYLPENNTPSEAQTQTGLPFGLKLSNHLPNINIKSYNLSLVDLFNNNSYGIDGENLKISDFILDKKIKLSTDGKIVFEDKTISEYNIKVFNKIMPELSLNELVFAPAEESTQTVEAPQINIIDLLKPVSSNDFHANLFTDIKTSGSVKNPKIRGLIKVDEISTAVDGKDLPQSYLDLNFKGSKTNIDSMFFTSNDENEKTQIIGNITSGKKPAIDLTVRSNAKFINIINLIDSIAKSFGVNDFDTLSATGGIDSDFNINSNLKKVSSTGYLKVLPSSLKYGLYNVSIDDIKADIDMMNNNININNAGFSILGHPLSITGFIKEDSTTDISINADKLSLKGLLAAAGQAALLKENDINSGTLSLNASLKGKLDKIKPEINSAIQNLNILNKASSARLTLNQALIKILCNEKSASGDVAVNSLNVNYAGENILLPSAKINIDEKDIKISDSKLLLNNSQINITGAVKDYISDKMNINLLAQGNVASSDIAAFLPKEFVSLISYKGSLPLNVKVTGNDKAQNIDFDLSANPNNYVSLVDIDLLKNQITKIHSNIEIIGDTLNLTNTGISNNSGQIAKLSGNVEKLYSNPKLNLNISVPNQVSFPIWGVPNSNISALGSVSVLGSAQNPQLKGSVLIPDISMEDMDFMIKDLNADLHGSILNGTASAKKFKSGGIEATDLSAKFSLKDYSKFYLNDINANAFDGKINGKISYSINDSKIGIDMTGTGLNSTKAVAGAAGINNALTGVMNFNAKLGMQGVTDKDIIKSLKGNINFNIDEGRFISIGRLENLVNAQNVSSNSILKSAISALSTVGIVQEADKYKNIKGEMTLSNGSAEMSKILVAGPLMAYYVNGTYNILPNTANIVILGRLDGKVVSVLGPLGELSVEKLLSYIPKFGTMTSNILKQLTSDPASENTSLIPSLTGGSTNFKDFKVVFNGPVESSSSVRSFKWLSVCDTSKLNIKEELQNAKDAVKTNITDRVENAKTNAQNIKNNVNNLIETQRNKAQEVKNSFNQTKSDIQSIKENSKQNSENVKNLFKNVIKNSTTRPGAAQ